MKVIRQKNKWDCLVATTMMITGCEYEECANSLWDGESYSVSKLVQFCASKGLMLAFQEYHTNDEGMLFEEYKIKTEEVLKVPAYVQVQSEFNKNYTHACYYDGEMICDPATGIRREISEMHILHWMTIRKLEDVFDQTPLSKDVVSAIATCNGPGIRS